jgi:hypothetical protein
MQNYAKKDVYADVEEEGGTINRLVAVAGQPIPAAYDHLVADGDKSQTPPEVDAAAADPALGYGPSTTRSAPEAPGESGQASKSAARGSRKSS